MTMVTAKSCREGHIAGIATANAAVAIDRVFTEGCDQEHCRCEQSRLYMSDCNHRNRDRKRRRRKRLCLLRVSRLQGPQLEDAPG